MTDGILSIDTSINDKGFNKGIDNMVATTKKGMKEVADHVSGALSSSGGDLWDEAPWVTKQKVLLQALDEHGDAWQNMSAKQQRAIYETIIVAQSAGEEVTNLTENLEELTPPTESWKGSLGGVSRVLSAIFPRMYRLQRATGGVADIAESLDKSVGTISTKMKVMGLIVAVVFAAIIIAVVALAAAAVKAFLKMVATLSNVTDKTSELGKQLADLNQAFDDVKGSLYSLIATLLPTLIPIVMKIVDWMIKWLNILAQVIALLSGQTSYKKYIMGSYKSDVEDIEKAAKGTLAAFDDINVLAEKGVEPGGFGTPQGMSFEEVPIDEAVVTWLKDIETFLANAALKAENLFNELFKMVGIDWDWGDMEGTWDDTWLLFTAAWDDDWEEFFLTILPRMLTRFSSAFGFDLSEEDWRKWIEDLKVAWDELVVEMNEGNEEIETGWDKIVASMAGTWDEVGPGLLKAWEGLKSGFSKAWSFIVAGAIGMSNGIITAVESMVNFILEGVNLLLKGFALIPGVEDLGHLNKIYIPRVPVSSVGKIMKEVPKLASGAVIPPNSAFAAILGDQTRGRNIEAPEDLIRQIVREESGQGGSQEITIKFEGTMAQFIRQLKPVITKEDTRIGKSLLSGGIV